MGLMGSAQSRSGGIGNVGTGEAGEARIEVVDAVGRGRGRSRQGVDTWGRGSRGAAAL